MRTDANATKRNSKRNRLVARRRFVVILIILAAFLAIVGWCGYPYIPCFKENQALSKIQADDLAMKKEIERMNYKLKGLKTEAGLTAEARAQGFIKQGEQVIIMPDFPPPTAPTEKTNPNAWGRFINWFHR